MLMSVADAGVGLVGMAYEVQLLLRLVAQFIHMSSKSIFDLWIVVSTSYERWTKDMTYVG